MKVVLEHLRCKAVCSVGLFRVYYTVYLALIDKRLHEL